MARKKAARKKKSVSKRKPAQKKKLVAKKKPAKKKATLKKRVPARKKPAKAAKKAAPILKKAAKKKSSSRRTGGAASRTRETAILESRRGLGAESGGQSGDTQGLSRREHSDSESVEELMEEGQYLEAEAVGGVEDAPDADEGEVRTHEVPEDDVPEEYLDKDQD
jgi:hypothetical protein